MPKILTSDMFHDCPQVWDIICRVEQSPVGHAMKRTVENSPYHREESTWIHTEMVLEAYKTHFMPHRSASQNKIALIALAFHDVGKPSAEEVLEKKDGTGTYRRYAGHEQDSAVAFTERWLEDPVLREFVSVDEARKIRFIIENHLPYGYRDSKKRSDLMTAIKHTLREDEQTFYDCLRSDCWGRISDDHVTKKQDVEEWIDSFRKVPLTINRTNVQMGKCYLMIGPSGSGKSTWTGARIRACDKVVSMDTTRAVFWKSRQRGQGPEDAKEFYREIFQFAMDNERDFARFLDEEIRATMQTLRITKGDLYVDNVNGSKKARARYVQEARAAGMKVVAVEFWNTFQTIAARQKTRPDKEVPVSSLKQQYYAQTCAWLGSEVDEVIVVPGV